MPKNDLEHRPLLTHSPEERMIQAAQEQNLRLRVSTFPNDSHSWYMLGCLLRRQRKFTDAEQALRKAVTLNPSPLVFWSELASALEDLGHDKVDPVHLRKLGVEKPEMSYPPGELISKLRMTKSLDGLRKTEAIPRIISDASSPCVTCEDFTYYGCRRQEVCVKLIRWRARNI